MRRTMVAALTSCACEKARSRLRRFLAGLSADELEFLAGFQGARILERCSGPSDPPDYACCAPPADLDHKMLVLREYLVRCDAL
jgi:hypothetical protein